MANRTTSFATLSRLNSRDGMPFDRCCSGTQIGRRTALEMTSIAESHACGSSVFTDCGPLTAKRNLGGPADCCPLTPISRAAVNGRFPAFGDQWGVIRARSIDQQPLLRTGVPAGLPQYRPPTCDDRFPCYLPTLFQAGFGRTLEPMRDDDFPVAVRELLAKAS